MTSYESDALTAFHVRPAAVVPPEAQDEVIETVRLYHRHAVLLAARGSGTSLSGGSLPVKDGIVIALNYLNRVLGLDPREHIAVVEPGAICLSVSASVATESLSLLDFPGDQAAIARFSGYAELLHPLSDDRASLIAALQLLAPSGVSRHDLALAVSRQELIGPRHLPANSRSLILLTDGRPNGVDEATVLAEAAATKSLGITIFTIGLGQDVNGTLLQQMASSPSHYYYAPSTVELIDIYERIACAIRCPDK